MKICSRLSVFLAMFGWSIAGGFMYGDYPPPEKILEHLAGDECDMSARFRRSFCEVREEAAKSRISGQGDPRKLVGEKELFLLSPKEEVSSERLADDEGNWSRRYFVSGDFLVKIDGLTVFASEDIDKLTSDPEYRRGFKIGSGSGCREDERYAALADVFKTLASGVFMERLFGEATVETFFDYTGISRTTVYVFCYPNFDETHPSTVSFHLMYRQVLKNRKDAYYPLWIGFDVRYDIEKNCFTNDPVKLSTLRVGTRRIDAKKSIED